MSPDAPAIHPRFWLSIARHRPSSSFITFVMMNGYCSRQNHTHTHHQSSIASLNNNNNHQSLLRREREGESGTNLRRIRSRLILAHVMLVNRPVLFDPQLRDRDLARVLLLQSSEVCKRVLDVRWLSEDVHSEAALKHTNTHENTHVSLCLSFSLSRSPSVTQPHEYRTKDRCCQVPCC